MIADLDTVVLGVSQRTSRDGSKVMYDVNLGDGQAYTSFDAPLATKAHQLTGQQVTARVEAKPKPDGSGHYMNLRDIAPQGQLPAMAAPLPSGATPMGAPVAFPAQAQGQAAFPQAGAPAASPFPGGQAQAPGQGIPQAAPRQGGGGMSAEDKARVTRLSAVQSAAIAVAAAYEGTGDGFPWGKLFSLAEAFVQYGYNGVNPLGAQPSPAGVQAPTPGQPAPIVPVAETPAGVAAFANAEQPGAVQVGAPVPATPAAGDEIPF